MPAHILLFQAAMRIQLGTAAGTQARQRFSVYHWRQHKAGDDRKEKQAEVKRRLTWSLTFPSQQQPHMMSYVCRHHHVTRDYTSTSATQEQECVMKK